MEYKYTKCPICGSNEIKKISLTKIGDDVVFEYKCLSCDSLFSSNSLLEKDKTVAETAIREKELKIIEEQGNEINLLKKEMNSKTLDAKEVFKKNIQSVVEIFAFLTDEKGMSGTGFIYKDKYVVTNAHIIHLENNEALPTYSYVCHFYKQEKAHNLKLVCYDDDLDLAIFEFEDFVGVPINFSSEKLETGEKCFAIGNSKGQGISIVEGIVSDNQRFLEDTPFIMFSAQVTKGNSGGPLLNGSGDLIGVVTLGRSDVSAMNYAIPVTIVDKYIKDMEKKGII